MHHLIYGSSMFRKCGMLTVMSITEKTLLVNEEKKDVGMVECFSKKYGNKGRAFNYLQSDSYVKMPVSASCYIPTSLPPVPSSIIYYLKLNSGVGH